MKGNKMKQMNITTSRLTGLFYLGLGLTGMFAYLFARSKLYVAEDAAATALNLVDNESLARLGIAAEIALVGFQALVSVWFYKLFKKKDSFAAGLIAVFGMVNAILILVASAFWLTALNNALAGNSPESTMQLFDIHENIWLVGNLFFGMWLVPMAISAKKAGLPKLLVWLVLLGGIGYVLSTFTAILLPNQPGLTEALPFAATFGEFWMIGYLLFKPVKA